MKGEYTCNQVKKKRGEYEKNEKERRNNKLFFH
jgi:hypothetical protein